MSPVHAGVETGGTRTNCAVGGGPDDIRVETSFPTTTPDETIEGIVAFLREQEPLAGVGIGSFGPVDVDPDSPTWGHVTSTPKPGWANTELAPRIARELGVPVAFDTDVNAAGTGEHRFGAGRGVDSFVYLTVGTGIGGGAIVDGRPLHGLSHPEMGHVPVRHDPARDPFEGSCPFHGDCLEGLASGAAMRERWGVGGEDLPADHPAWQLEADYLGEGIAAIAFVLSPRRVIMGGGVMHTAGMLERTRAALDEAVAGYIEPPELVLPELGDRAGVLGAIALAGGGDP